MERARRSENVSQDAQDKISTITTSARQFYGPQAGHSRITCVFLARVCETLKRNLCLELVKVEKAV